MSTVGTITKLATGVAGKAAHAVTHPVATVTAAAGQAKAAAGQAKKVAATVVGGAHDNPERTEPAEPPEPPVALTPDPVSAAEEAVAAEEARAAAAEAEPVEPEATVTEIKTPAGTTAAGPGYNPDTGETDLHQPDTEPLMDPSLTKAIRTEAETMRKASDPGGE